MSNEKLEQHVDVVIVGAGMVGAAVAVGLARLGLKIALVEKSLPKPFVADEPLDLRVSALNLASVSLLDKLGAIDSILAMRAAEYKELHVWAFDMDKTKFLAKSIDADNLGYIVENRVIQLALLEQVSLLQNIELINADIEDVVYQQELAIVSLSNGAVISTSLVVAADGANSKVRSLVGLGISSWDYRHHALLINIKMENSCYNDEATWQQFTPSGPRAFLPLAKPYASLVWYDDPKIIKKLKVMTPDHLKEQIIANFPEDLGSDFTVLSQDSFALTRRLASNFYAKNVVLVGDAAHTINPLAGQGVNLGFKDVSALLDVIKEGLFKKEPWSDISNLKKYHHLRYADTFVTMTGMDVFYKTFKSSNPALKLLGQLGLKITQPDTILKKMLLNYASGYKIV